MFDTVLSLNLKMSPTGGSRGQKICEIYQYRNMVAEFVSDINLNEISKIKPPGSEGEKFPNSVSTIWISFLGCGGSQIFI